MNRRQLLLGIAAAALQKPEFGPGGPIYNIVPDPAAMENFHRALIQKELYSETLNYIQIFQKTLEVSRTAVQIRLQNPERWREEKQPLQAWWEDELVER